MNNPFPLKLQKLLKMRKTAEESIDDLDHAIWDAFGCWGSIVITDLCGFSAITRKRGIIHFLELIQKNRELTLPVAEKNGGKIIKVEGDSFFLAFKSPKEALAFCLEVRDVHLEYCSKVSDDQKVNLCLGIATGRYLDFENDAFGDPINIASKLGEDTANKNEILLCEESYRLSGEFFPNLPFQQNQLTSSNLSLSYYSV